MHPRGERPGSRGSACQSPRDGPGQSTTRAPTGRGCARPPAAQPAVSMLSPHPHPSVTMTTAYTGEALAPERPLQGVTQQQLRPQGLPDPAGAARSGPGSSSRWASVPGPRRPQRGSTRGASAGGRMNPGCPAHGPDQPCPSGAFPTASGKTDRAAPPRPPRPDRGTSTLTAVTEERPSPGPGGRQISEPAPRRPRVRVTGLLGGTEAGVRAAAGSRVWLRVSSLLPLPRSQPHPCVACGSHGPDGGSQTTPIVGLTGCNGNSLRRSLTWASPKRHS